MGDTLTSPLPYISPEEFQRRRLLLGAPPTIPAQAPTPIPDISSVAPVNPADPVANITGRMKYEQLRQQEPTRAEYPPSRLRTLLSILGGIGAGAASGNLGTGINVGRHIYRGPFIGAEEAYQQKLGAAKDIAESEETGKTKTAQATELGLRGEAEKERAGAEKARRRREEVTTEGMIPGTPEAEEKERQLGIKGLLPLEKDTWTLTLKDGTKVPNATFNATDLSHTGPDGTVYGKGVVDTATRELPGAKLTSAFQNAIATFTTQNKRPPTLEEIYKIQERLANASATGSGLLKERGAQTEYYRARTRQARLDAESKEVSPQEIAQAKAFQTAHPQQYADYMKGLPPAARKILYREAPPKTLPDRTAQTRVNNANTALQHVGQLRDMIEDPEIKANLTPLLGRLEIVKSALGTDTIGFDNKNITEKEQEFLSYLTQNLLWETTSGVGTRPARQTIALIKGSAARASETYGRIKGQLDAEENSASRVIDGMLFGAPEKKTQVEGFSNVKPEEQ